MTQGRIMSDWFLLRDLNISVKSNIAHKAFYSIILLLFGEDFLSIHFI